MFVGNYGCQKGLVENHIVFPKSWKTDKVVCNSYETDTFMIDLKLIRIELSLGTPTHWRLGETAKKARRLERLRKFFYHKL